MNWALRIVLVFFAVLALVFVVRRISKGKLLMADATFWFLFALSLVIFAVFPQCAFFFSQFLGIESPANFVFLFILSILFFRELFSTMKISKLNNQVASLAQEQALRDSHAGSGNQDQKEIENDAGQNK